MITGLPSWSLVIHIIVGGLAAVLMARRQPLVPFLAGCVVWLLYGDYGAMGGVLACTLLAFIVGLLDTQLKDG